MKVLVIGTFGIEQFASHISDNLINLGHDVLEHEISSTVKLKLQNQLASKALSTLENMLSFTQSGISKRIKNIKKSILHFSPDLILVTYDYLTSHEVDKMKEISHAPIALWFPDSVAGFPRGLFLNANYDFLFFKDTYIVNALKPFISGSVFYMPECFNDLKMHSTEYEKLKYQCDLSTAGGLHSYRVAFFNQLTELDLNIKLWGPKNSNWIKLGKLTKYYQGEPVYNEEKYAAFKEAKIVINNLHYTEIDCVNVRTFEIAGAGGFQLIDYRRGLNELFEIGNEIVSFNNIDELKELIIYFLEHDDERELIANKAKTKALKCHTYRHRLELIIDTIFSNKNGFESALLK